MTTKRRGMLERRAAGCMRQLWQADISEIECGIGFIEDLMESLTQIHSGLLDRRKEALQQIAALRSLHSDNVEPEVPISPSSSIN